MHARTIPDVGLGDVVEFLDNRVEVIELYPSESGTPFVLGLDVDGNSYRFPVRLCEVLFSQEHEGDGPVEVEVEVAPGLWVAEDATSFEDVEPRHIWA